MATESFGASFGNPRQYMGSSPIGDIWKGLKTGAAVYGMEKSGLVKYLDELGVKQKNGVFSFENKKDTAVTGAVPPTSQPMGGPITYGNQAAEAPIANAIPPTSQPMGGPLGSSAHPTTGVPYYGKADTNYAPPTSGITTPEARPVPMPELTGKSILNDISLNNPDDYNPAPLQSGYNTTLASGNEYQNVPGYGKTQKIMSSFFGLA